MDVVRHWAIWRAPETGEEQRRVRRLAHPNSKLYADEIAVVDAAAYRGAVEAERTAILALVNTRAQGYARDSITRNALAALATKIDQRGR